MMIALPSRAGPEVGAERDAACQVDVFYSDVTTRAVAIQTCDRLVRRFLNEVEFEFGWWNLRYLADSTVARMAIDALQRSDLVLMALHAGSALKPVALKAIAAGLAARPRAGGALALLVPESQIPSAWWNEATGQLRALAHSAHLEFVTAPELAALRGLPGPATPAGASLRSPKDSSGRQAPQSPWGLEDW